VVGPFNSENVEKTIAFNDGSGARKNAIFLANAPNAQANQW